MANVDLSTVSARCTFERLVCMAPVMCTLARPLPVVEMKLCMERRRWIAAVLGLVTCRHFRDLMPRLRRRTMKEVIMIQAIDWFELEVLKVRVGFFWYRVDQDSGPELPANSFESIEFESRSKSKTI